jgi:hypothetical protein
MILALCLSILALVYLLGWLFDPPARRAASEPKPIKVYTSRRK